MLKTAFSFVYLNRICIFVDKHKIREGITMKAYLQYRSIVCRKFADIDHLIGDNKLWNEIYSIFRTLKKEHKLSIPAIEVFE